MTRRFREAMWLMRRHDPQRNEDGYHMLLPVAHEHVDELIEAFQEEHDDHGLRCWLLELIGEARSEKALPVLAEQLNSSDEQLQAQAERGLKLLNSKEARRLCGGTARRKELRSPKTRECLDHVGEHRQDDNSSLRTCCSGPSPVEARGESGLARMRSARCDGAQGGRVVAVRALGECLEIGEQRDGHVVLGRLAGRDQRVDARPPRAPTRRLPRRPVRRVAVRARARGCRRRASA